jgi:hypothetical protein
MSEKPPEPDPPDPNAGLLYTPDPNAGLYTPDPNAGLNYTPGPELNYTPGPELNYTPGPELNYTPGPASSASVTTSVPYLEIRASATSPNQESDALPVDLAALETRMLPAPSEPGSNVKAVAPFTSGEPVDSFTGRQPMDSFRTSVTPSGTTTRNTDVPESLPDLSNLGLDIAASNPVNAVIPSGTTTRNTDVPKAMLDLVLREVSNIDKQISHSVGATALDAFAQGATGAVLRYGGELGVMFGISEEDDFELTMLQWHLSELEHNPELVMLGAMFGDQLVHYGDPGPTHAPEGVEVLHANFPAMKAPKGALKTLKGPALKKLQGAREIGQEAHRQILKYDYPTWTPEVTIELIPGVIVRKDALKLTNQGAKVLIIKPDTISGRISAARRKALMEAAGYKTKIELYNPSNPDFQPSSKKYIGSQ